MHKILIANDHAGFGGKEVIKPILDRLGIAYQDLGTHTEESVDYPDYAQQVAEAVAAGKADAGILVCGSGIGMQIAANKVPGIRAALAWNEETARLCRSHNDANVLAIGYRTTPPDIFEQIVHTFLTTNFEGGRHQVRVNKIAALESDSLHHTDASHNS